MKTIVQLLLAGLVLIACARAGESAWRYYGFKDAVEQEARFGEAASPEQLRQRVLAMAEEHAVTVEPDAVLVERRGDQTAVTVQYVDAIRLVPAVYTRRQLYDFEIVVRPVRPLTAEH